MATGPAGDWWILAGVCLLVASAITARRRLTVRLAALLAALLVFWLELALTRAQLGSPSSPAASRYVYPAAFLLVLILVEAFAGLRPPSVVLLALAVGVFFVVESDVNVLETYGHAARGVFAREAALLGRAECDPRLGAGFQLDPTGAPGVTVGPYLAAVRALGTPPGQACPYRRGVAVRAG